MSLETVRNRMSFFILFLLLFILVRRDNTIPARFYLRRLLDSPPVSNK